MLLSDAVAINLDVEAVLQGDDSPRRVIPRDGRGDEARASKIRL
jgi:hypothetical protein